MLIYLFGLPAAGKNYVGEVLAEEFGYTFYDGDLDLTPEMRDAVREGRPFTEVMRDRFYAVLVGRLAALRPAHPDLAFLPGHFQGAPPRTHRRGRTRRGLCAGGGR